MMQFSASRKSILQALGHCIEVAKHGTTQQARGILVDVHSKEVWCTAIASPLSISCDVDKATSVAPGRIVVPADAFEFVKAMPDGEVKVSASDLKVTLSAPGTSRKFTFFALSAEDFPAFPERPEAKACTLTGNILRRLIERTSYAVYTGTDREELAGISVIVSKGKAEAVAADGRMVAIAEEIGDDISGEASIFVTSQAYRVVQMLMSSLGEDWVDVYVSENRIHVVCDAGEVQYLLPAAQPPKVVEVTHRIFPKTGVDVPRVALLAATKAVCVGADKLICQANVTAGDGVIRLQVATARGDNEESVQCSGELDLSFVVNAYLLASTLEAIKDDTVSLLAGEDTPLVGVKAPTTTAAVMKVDPRLIVQHPKAVTNAA